MLRVVLVGGFFFTSLPLMIGVQWLLAAIKSPLWGPASVAYYRLLRRLLRIRLTVIGAPLAGQPVLIASNHVSWVDIVVYASIAPMVFVAKREVAGWPLIGAAARVQKVVFVDRVRRQQTAGAVNDMAQRLAEGHPVVLFAEGTSSDGNRVLPFRSALIGAAEAAGAQRGPDGAPTPIMIQPAAICYTGQHGVPLGRDRRALVAWYGDLDFTPHMTRFMREGAVDAVVQFGTPVPAGDAADRKALARTLETSVRSMMISALRGRALTPAASVTMTPQTAGIPFPAETG